MTIHMIIIKKIIREHSIFDYFFLFIFVDYNILICASHFRETEFITFYLHL